MVETLKGIDFSEDLVVLKGEFVGNCEKYSLNGAKFLIEAFLDLKDFTISTLLGKY